MVLYAPFRNLAVPGSVRFNGTITPAVTGTLNDWNPTGFNNASVVLFAPIAATTITGMATALDGTSKLLIHAGGNDDPVTLSNLNSGSASAQQLLNGFQGNFRMQRGDTALFRYDGANAKWRLVRRQGSDYDQVRWPGFSGRTEASWWKQPGSCARQRFGMFEAECIDGAVFLSADDATGPMLTVSTDTTPYVAGGSPAQKNGAGGIRTGARLFQPQWNVIAGWDRVSVPSTPLADTRARWGCFNTFLIYGVASPAALEGAYFQFDYGTDMTQLYAVTSSGSAATLTPLPTAPPATQADWVIDMTSTRARFFRNRSLVAEHTTDLPAAGTPLGHSVGVELLAGGAAVKRFTWARSWYSFGRVSA